MKFFKRIPLVLIAIAGFFFLFNLRDLFPSRAKNKPIPLGEWHYIPKEHKSFVIIIPSHNNAKYCEKNLISVLEQTYPNYRVIYIDDASSDQTLEKVKTLVTTAKKNERFTFLHNATTLGATTNFYRAIHLCSDEEIVVMLDGDDWLSHDKVLEWLNCCYDNPSVWMTYGSACEYPSYKRTKARHEIPSATHKSHNYRKLSSNLFLLSHLKTAYAGLFKRIKLQDLQMNNQFFPTSAEEAFMLPAIEMAKEHAYYIRDILYISNRETPLSDDKIHAASKQTCKSYILNLPSYSPIKNWRDSQ